MSFTRYPVHLRNALMFGESLGAVRNSLANAGLQYELDSGLKVFCAPSQYPDVVDILDDVKDQLRPYHVLTSASCRTLVRATVEDLRGSHRVRIKDERTIGMVRRDDNGLLPKELSASGVTRIQPGAAPSESTAGSSA